MRVHLTAIRALFVLPILLMVDPGAAAGRASARPPTGKTASARVEALIARMTMDEKVGQLSLYAAVAAGALANPANRLQSDATQSAEIRAGRVTGLFNGAGLESKRRAQQMAVNESRLGIPLLFGADVIHGFRTVFPVPLAEAASWEPELAERTARAAAVEASADGFRWTFAPMVDIARDARWGRGVEGAGEDVLLGRQFAAARVRGFQGDDLSRGDSLLATPKHFAAYGAAEGGLDYNGADISDRTLRQIYLPPFRAALGAGALSIMSAFNEIAGIPSTANPALLTGVLRREWGFRGFVVADYTADEELVAHGFAADGREAARLAFLAGTDVSMQSGLYIRHLPDLVAAGEVPLATLDDAVRRVLKVKERLGLFDRPMRGLDATDAAAEPSEWPAHRILARHVAQRSIVMLKNDGDVLPLPKSGKKIALIGPFGSGPHDLFGPWTLFSGGPPPIDLEQGLRAALVDPALITVEPGSGVDAALPGGIEAAVAAATSADVVLLAIGESERMSGEARSRSRIEIPAPQQALAEAVTAAVAATGKPVVVLLRNGRALALQGAVRDAQAILVTWFLGAETGSAVADVVFGDVGPSGRLPVSFPQTTGQVPYYYSHKRTGRPLPDDEPTSAYKARYLDATDEALYAFGHGLGYGRIVYERVELLDSHLRQNGTLKVQVRVTNTGTRAADEVVQLYVAARASSITPPVRELKAYRKLGLAPGASSVVTFTLTRNDLSFVGTDSKPRVEPGVFDFWIGPSATGGVRQTFTSTP